MPTNMEDLVRRARPFVWIIAAGHLVGASFVAGTTWSRSQTARSLANRAFRDRNEAAVNLQLRINEKTAGHKWGTIGYEQAKRVALANEGELAREVDELRAALDKADLHSHRKALEFYLASIWAAVALATVLLPILINGHATRFAVLPPPERA